MLEFLSVCTSEHVEYQLRALYKSPEYFQGAEVGKLAVFAKSRFRELPKGDSIDDLVLPLM